MSELSDSSVLTAALTPRKAARSAGAAPAPAPDHEATTEDRSGAAAATAGRVFKRSGLVVIHPRRDDDRVEAWLAKASALVGRGRDADIRPTDGRISRAHASLERRADGFTVRDLHSRHGTFVQGERVGAGGAFARTGNLVRFGETLTMVVDDVDRHRSPARRIAAERLQLPKDVVAGPALSAVWDQAIRAAHLGESVLILGETGSGKECVARIVHAYGPGGGPFVGVNVAALPEPLFEAELFGHAKGAFTGATGARLGAFREAAGGVLFLDEVGDLRPELQVKLLRAIDLRRVRPLGADGDVPITARIVCATSRDLGRACEAGEFRADLWYRLSGVVLRVPPLRERPDEVTLLVHEILRERAAPLRLAVETAETLALARWEGNARQLRHVLGHAVDRALACDADELRPEHLPDLGSVQGGGDGALTARRLQDAMRTTGGVASRAADLLGISRTTLYAALKRHQIDVRSMRRR